MLANQRLLNEASPVGLPGVFGGETDGIGVKAKVEAVEPRGVEPVVPGGAKPRAADPATIDLTGGKKKKDKAKLKKVEREKICQEVGIGIWEIWDETRLH